MSRKKEMATVLSQEMLAEGIFSLWLETSAAAEAKPGQFLSIYTNDGTKLLPRPISICEIDKEKGALRMVYRVTGEKTGTKQFSELKAGDQIPVIGPVLFSYGFMTYLCIILACVLAFFLAKTRKGLNLRAVGENPATADAAGINVTLYKYLATCIGCGISGLGGLYFVMEYSGGTWTNNGFGDRGWLAVALVIFSLWKPLNAIWGSILFGGLYILYLYLPGVGRSAQEIFKMLPYLVTIIVLIFTSFRRKRENQPPAGLGQPYFREER